MAEEQESPVERLSEDLHEEAQHARESWLRGSALLSALLAVIAAVASLKSGHAINTSMLAQIQAAEQWNYYQAKGLKLMLVETEQTLLQQLGKPLAADSQRLQKYQAEQEAIKTKAEALAESAQRHLEQHEVLSRAVTISQIAIAIVAIGVLTRRRHFVLVAGVLGIGGLWFLLQGLWMS